MNVYDYMIEYAAESFEPLKVLHSGDRGNVTLIRHRVSGRPYVFCKYEGSAEVYKKLAGVESPNLPLIYDAAEKDGKAAVIEEYIQGENLHEMLKSSLFTYKEARRIVLEISNALSVLHGLGAVHRDVKPENVILSARGAVLVDFDSSRIYKQSRSSDTTVLGTTGFAPPEQYGMGQTDPRSDIYALCVLMNFMLTGKHPSTELAPGRAGRIIKRGTMMNPESRYKDIYHFMDAL